MRQRLSIARLMVLTGMIALNLAALAAMAREFDLIVAAYLCGPIVILAQLVLLAGVAGRRERRPFRLGFAAVGTLSAAALFWAYMLHKPTQLVLSTVYSSFWDGLGRIAPKLERLASSRESLRLASFTLHYFGPQALLASAGGAVVQAIAKPRTRVGRKRGRVEPEIPAPPSATGETIGSL